MTDASTEMDEVIGEIRRSVAALCEDYPGEYWREKDRDRAYPCLLYTSPSPRDS